MTSKVIVVGLKTGLEARPAALLVQLANEFKSDIRIVYEEKKVNAKSIMGVMSLGLAEGEPVAVSADGEDEKEAMEKIENYLCGKE